MISNQNQIKGTVSVVSSDPPCKDGNADLQRYPLKYTHVFIFTCGFSEKIPCPSLTYEASGWLKSYVRKIENLSELTLLESD